MVAVSFHLFVALPVNFHESIMLKDHINIVISMLKEKICECGVNLTLSLASRNHPNLLLNMLVVQVGK